MEPVFRDKPRGPVCNCDRLFSDFKWHELASLRAEQLPRVPGVYVVRVIERGVDPAEARERLLNVISETNWVELLSFVKDRLMRLNRIGDCPVIYIGSSSNIRVRFKDLAGLRHTAFFPVLTLLLGTWRLDYGFKTTGSRDEALRLEEWLKMKYAAIHGGPPALVEV